MKPDLKHLGVKEDDELSLSELIIGLVFLAVVLAFAIGFGVVLGG